VSPKTEQRPRKRLTAAERREHLLAAAVAEFSRTGYHGTATETIAERAGISQPYLFRLYGTKKDLFLACVDRCFDRVAQTFRDAIASPPAGAETPLEAMGHAYVDMLADRELLLFQMQTYAASDDPDIREVARRRYGQLGELIEELGGVGHDAALRFAGQGMLLNVAASLGLPADEYIWDRDAR
jgi:AcrR family transcriptional regulator